ncbi:MAG: DUF192 domain-containing protein [Gammaproteobacteria bacterium]|nr:DUF192 domain-containing protein [Gammaproteobacteria bacterium]
MRHLLYSTLIAAALLAGCKEPVAVKPGADSNLDEFFGKSELIIEADDGKQHRFDVYLATEFDQQRRGLMFVRSLADNTGMLFVYDDDAMHSMWMKNTFIPLDMLFIRSDGTVSSVIRDTQPLSLESRGSVEPVRYVLELKGGAARRLGIGKASRMIWDGNHDVRE